METIPSFISPHSSSQRCFAKRPKKIVKKANEEEKSLFKQLFNNWLGIHLEFLFVLFRFLMFQ